MITSNGEVKFFTRDRMTALAVMISEELDKTDFKQIIEDELAFIAQYGDCGKDYGSESIIGFKHYDVSCLISHVQEKLSLEEMFNEIVLPALYNLKEKILLYSVGSYSFKTLEPADEGMSYVIETNGISLRFSHRSEINKYWKEGEPKVNQIVSIDTYLDAE